MFQKLVYNISKDFSKCCRGENCKRRQNYAGSSIPHICRACNAQNANTRIYAIYHETKAKIVKAIVVSRSEARGSSSNGILVGDQMSKCQFTFWMIQKCKTMQIYPWSQKWIAVVFSFQRQEYYWHGKSLKLGKLWSFNLKHPLCSWNKGTGLSIE